MPDQVPEIYVSIDVESNGPAPGLYSMLSLGLCAFEPFPEDGVHEVGSFSANLELLPHAMEHPETMAWWAKNPEAYARTRENVQDPREAMRKAVAWAKGLPGTPVLAGYPILYDGMFLLWYMHAFAGECPFGFSGVDVASYSMPVMHRAYRDCKVKNMPAHWLAGRRPGLKHVALDDARDQGRMLLNIMSDANGMPPNIWEQD